MDELNSHLDVLEPARPVFADAECAALSASMEQPAHLAAIQIIQPHTFSAAVFKVENAQQSVIVKHRSRAWKPRREANNYRISRQLGLQVVSPCIPLDAALATPDSVWAQLIQVASEKTDGEMEWGTAEKCCLLWPDAQTAPDHPLRNLEIADIATAYCTIDDKEQFAQLLAEIDQVSLEELLVYHIISLQSDGTAANLMLRYQPHTGQFALNSIDNTCCWAEHEAGTLHLANDDEDSRDAAYWYPAILLLPGADIVPSEQLQQRVSQWCVRELEAFVIQCGESRASAVAAGKRLEILQAQMKTHPDLSLRQLAFHVVNEWERDFEASLGNYGIKPLYEALLICRARA